MRVLVTGATGFIGCYLVPRLREQGQEVALLLRPHYRAGRPLPEPLAALCPELQLVYADLRQAEETAVAVAEAQPDVVFHLAAAGVSEPFIEVEKALSSNLQGTLNLLQACYAAAEARPRFVNARTPGERSALNVYAASKAAAWKFCQMYARTEGWPIMGAMIFQAYGPGQPAHTLVAAALEAALAGADFPTTSGQQKRDWIYVEDVVAGLAAFLDADLPPGSSAELGTGCPRAVADVVRQIYQMVGRGGQPRIGALPDRPGEVARQAADAVGTASLLGWRARYSLAEGLQRMRTQRETSTAV